MSPAEGFLRHDKLRTDRAISAACARLPRGSPARAVFFQLLDCVRERSPRLLAAPAVQGHHPGVETLVNLSRFAPGHLRSIPSWPGTDASWRVAVRSLAQHLVGRYPVPRFLGAAWYASGDPLAEEKRRWFIAHAAGAPFRSLHLPMRMTREMERIFLASPDHLGIEYAMRRAELLGLGASTDLTDAVLATRLGADLTNGEFWRTVWLFLVRNADAIDLSQVGPVIDFLQAIRCEPRAINTPGGVVMREPTQPDFSLKGRTPRSLLRLMEEWHRGESRVTGQLAWPPSSLRPMVVEAGRNDPESPPTVWELIELTNAGQLRAEGAALHHCVGTYSHRCRWGKSRIWSLRLRRESSIRSVMTVEVDPTRNAVVQARGFRNRWPGPKALQILRVWAARERVRLTI